MGGVDFGVLEAAGFVGGPGEGLGEGWEGGCPCVSGPDGEEGG